MRYIILEGANASQLTDSVNSYIQAGWTPLGGVSVWSADDSFQLMRLYQAMTRNEPPSPLKHSNSGPG